jgi:hypothetical protein
MKSKRLVRPLTTAPQPPQDSTSEPLALPGRADFYEREIELVWSVLKLKHADSLPVNLDDLPGPLIKALGEHAPLRLVLPTPGLVDVVAQRISVKRERPLKVRFRDWPQPPPELTHIVHCTDGTTRIRGVPVLALRTFSRVVHVAFCRSRSSTTSRPPNLSPRGLISVMHVPLRIAQRTLPESEEAAVGTVVSGAAASHRARRCEHRAALWRRPCFSLIPGAGTTAAGDSLRFRRDIRTSRER